MSTIFDTSFADKDTVRRERHGKRWELSEEMALRQLFTEGATLQQMCEELQRPAAGVIPKLQELGCIRRDTYDWRSSASKVWYCKAKRLPNLTPPTNEAPPRAEETTMTKNIETRVLIQGQDASEMSDEQIFTLIGKLEQQIDKLGAIKAKPKKLEVAIAALQDDIKKLVDYVDSRDEVTK